MREGEEKSEGKSDCNEEREGGGEERELMNEVRVGMWINKEGLNEEKLVARSSIESIILWKSCKHKENNQTKRIAKWNEMRSQRFATVSGYQNVLAALANLVGSLKY